MNSILAIIPAREGSKSIKLKNIYEISGRPLIDYSIQLAKELFDKKKIENHIVSTDSEVIADIASSFGANIPFLRPKEISKDDSKSYEFIEHALNFYRAKGKTYDAVLLMQPTSPIRSFDIVSAAIDKFYSLKSESLISVYKDEYINDLVMYTSDNGDSLKPHNSDHNKGVRRQEHEINYIRNGSIYITKSSYLLENKRIISDFPDMIEMSKTSSINIDSQADLDLLLKIL